jgi:AraC-like DNA-binding protein
MFSSHTNLHLLHDDTFRRLCRARDFLAAHYQLPVALDQAAREACYSTFHFHRLFTGAFGETPHDFLTRRRIDHARRLLADGQMTVTQICLDAGYGSLGSFSASLSTGGPPSLWIYGTVADRVDADVLSQRLWRYDVVDGCERSQNQWTGHSSFPLLDAGNYFSKEVTRFSAGSQASCLLFKF